MIRKIKTLVLSILLCIYFNNYLHAQNNIKGEILWTTGNYIAVGGNVDSLHIYSKRGFNLYKSYPMENTITRTKWHPTENIVAVITQNSKHESALINLATDSILTLTNISEDGARALDWNYSGEFLAVGDNSGQVAIYNQKGELVKKFANQEGSTLSITALDWHPSKNLLITVSEKIRMFDMEGNLIKTIKHRPEDALLLAVAWHKSGEFFVIGDYGYEDVKSLLQYWSEQGELLKTIDISKAEYRNLVWNAKGTRLASASDALRIWDKNGKLISEGSSIDNLWGLTWNKRGTRIVTSSMDQHIILWNKNAKKLLDIE